MAYGRAGRWVVLVASAGALAAGCAEGGNARPDSGTGVFDAGGSDAASTSCDGDEDCPDDGNFCNGILICRERRCIVSAVPTCSDGIACTRDMCDPVANACRNMPDDAMCPAELRCYPLVGCSEAAACEFDDDCPGDGLFCSGVESCVAGACVSSGARSCDDGDTCTEDTCSESMAACVSTVYDDVLTNPMRCGTGASDCVVCPEPPADRNQVASCMEGTCGVVCAPGFVDADGDPANGCELACAPSGSLDLPDDAFTDSNCDGIDGDRARAIFVSTGGVDTNDGLTTASPVASFGRAFAVFAANPTRNQILVQTGTYTTSSPLALPTSGVGIYSGYGPGFTTRTDSRAQFVSSSSTALRAENLSAPTVIDRVNLTTDDQSGLSAPTVTLLVSNSADRLTLRFVTVLAGRGGNGRAGTTGATGAIGATGADGSGSTGGAGRGGGGNGGGGGGPGNVGQNGDPGTPNACGTATGGPGGRSGRSCADGDPGGGSTGGVGCTGSAGGHEAGGNGTGSLSGTTWTPSNGVAGSTGGQGGGAGGGGGGAGEGCIGFRDTGRGGGGGGGGGAGGGGGGSGGGGGASIGVLLLSSTLVVQQVRIQTSAGGNGGAGAGGGPGGPGGPGGQGVINSNNNQGRGGNGGRGGDGGPGGCGGGGGGGPSVAIWGNGPGSRYRELTPLIFNTGAGGTGGTSCGNPGAGGISQNLVSAFSD